MKKHNRFSWLGVENDAELKQFLPAMSSELCGILSIPAVQAIEALTNDRERIKINGSGSSRLTREHLQNRDAMVRLIDTALTWSENVPAAFIATPQNIADILSRATLLTEGDHSVPSLSTAYLLDISDLLALIIFDELDQAISAVQAGKLEQALMNLIFACQKCGALEVLPLLASTVEVMPTIGEKIVRNVRSKLGSETNKTQAKARAKHLKQLATELLKERKKKVPHHVLNVKEMMAYAYSDSERLIKALERNPFPPQAGKNLSGSSEPHKAAFQKALSELLLTQPDLFGKKASPKK